MKITLWRRGKSGAGENLPDLLKGKYQLVFELPLPDFIPDLTTELPHVYYTSHGKRFILEGWAVKPDTNELIIQINVVENPIPLMAILGVQFWVLDWVRSSWDG